MQGFLLVASLVGLLVLNGIATWVAVSVTISKVNVMRTDVDMKVDDSQLKKYPLKSQFNVPTPGSNSTYYVEGANYQMDVLVETGVTDSIITVNLTRVGQLVTLHVPQLAEGCGAGDVLVIYLFDDNCDSPLLPWFWKYDCEGGNPIPWLITGYAMVKDNGIYASGSYRFSGGNIIMETAETGGFFSEGACGARSFVTSWLV